MGFFDRLRNGWALLLASFGVMSRNKSLLLFPITTAALTLFIGSLFLTPIALQPSGHSYGQSAHWKEVGSRLFVEGEPTERDLAKGRTSSLNLSAQAKVYAVLFYFLSMFLATFFNVAFVHEILNALKGEPVSVASGIRFAGTKIRVILLWTLFAGLVGLLIAQLERKFGVFGNWVVRLLGAAWSVASVFVIPVLVVQENAGPLEALRSSAGLIKKTWGEALGGYAGLQLGGIVTMFATILLLGGSVYLGVAHQQWKLMAAGFASWFAFICAFSYMMSVAGQVYLCMLYQYAAAGKTPEGFTPEMLGSAWTPKS